MLLRSPCTGCDYETEDKKKWPFCVNCTARLDYVAELEGWDKNALEKTKEKVEIALKRRKSRYCDTPGCQGLYYARGKCKSCYWKMRRGTLGNGDVPSYFFHLRMTGDISKELVRLVKAIADQEYRSLNSQLIQFIEMGVIQWLRDQDKE